MLTSKPNRNRRKSTQSSEHIKHRRTRSGCFTCRGRRVKCDEARPVCDRCKKGSRDCVYPETSTLAKPSGNASKAVQGGNRESAASSSEDDDEADPERLKIVPGDGETGEAFNQNPPKTGVESADLHPSVSKIVRSGSETPSLVQDKGSSPTPSTEGSIGYPIYQSIGNSRTKDIGNDNPAEISAHAALGDEALLYAIVGFSAFHHTLQSDGKITDFLQYYNKSVSLLLRTLKRGDYNPTSTILAILQLATVEEFLGDWVNLSGHQKAAYEIITQNFSPQTMMQNETTRVILAWYTRFDVFAGLIGGFETVLSRQWFSYGTEYFENQVLKEPTKLSWKIERAVWQLRLIATDMSALFSKRGKGEISHEQFLIENEIVAKRIEEWKTKMDPALQNSQWLVTDFTGARPLNPDDIVDPYIPNIIYRGPLWIVNISIIDCADLTIKAYATCQLLEAVEFWPGSPDATIVACQASLGIACLFLPRDEIHAMWARRKLATIESHGFVEERTSKARDIPTEDLRDMKAIFSSLQLDDSEPDPTESLDK
ncbi:hypothetical protein B7494_g7590 [Chlorociboria aeruginascens]|nr:hypothetical protein B7494_g7590 [Chlorociboria aeruginascens]